MENTKHVALGRLSTQNREIYVQVWLIKEMQMSFRLTTFSKPVVIVLLSLVLVATYMPLVFADGAVNVAKTDQSDKMYQPYEPNWKSLDQHLLPNWFDDAKFGLFIHWGPYSSPNSQPYRHEFMKPEELTAEMYNPLQWVEIAKDAGARYITFTTKHGGGYAMYDSKYTKWDAMDSGPCRDLFGELVQACRQNNMPIIAYYCKDDMFLPQNAPVTNPFKIYDKKLYDQIVAEYDMKPIIDNWVEYFHNQIKEILLKYSPDGLWLDGTRLPYQYIRTPELIAWAYNHYPDIIVNDRIGSSSQRKLHGDFLTYERSWLKPVHILPHKWERCTALGGSWWYNPDINLTKLQSAEEILWAGCEWLHS